MTFEYGLLLGFIGLFIYVIGFTIVYIVIKINKTKKEKIEEEKNIKLPYEFK